MDKDKLSVYYVRLKDKTLSLSLRPLLATAMSKNVTVKKVIYGEPRSKLTASELYVDKAARKPVFIYAHGGGWVQGSNAIRDPYCSRIADLGFYVLNINYELAPAAKHPTQARNIFRAISYVFEKREEYNLDTDSVFLGGDSAGAHLAALAAGITVNRSLYDEFKIDFTYRGEFKIRGLVFICGVFDFLSCGNADFPRIKLYSRSYSGYDVREIEDGKLEEFFGRPEIMNMCPVTLVTPDYPPCMLITGEKDPLRPTTELFYERLKENNVKAAYFLGTGKYSVHGFPLFSASENGKRAMREVYSFLTDVLGGGYGLRNVGAAPVDSAEIGRSIDSESYPE
ncbi:MAG: alpha/beta hydrolase [Clostridiales bacterium]|jgi:acetyl esterase/lipase|nr:alpha/beta hydrolase [Clostridiales bacterium]